MLEMSLVTSGSGNLSLHQERLNPKKNSCPVQQHGQDSTGISSPPESFWTSAAYSEGERFLSVPAGHWCMLTGKSRDSLHCCCSSQTLQVCSHQGWQGALLHPARSTPVARGSRRLCACRGRQTCTPASRRGHSPHSSGSAGTQKGRVSVGPGHSPAHVRTLVRH